MLQIVYQLGCMGNVKWNKTKHISPYLFQEGYKENEKKIRDDVHVSFLIQDLDRGSGHKFHEKARLGQ